MLEAVMLIRPPFLYLILLVASLCFISLGISVTSSAVEDNLTYCVIMLHYDKVDYAEVIYCPNQVPDESVYSGSLEECRKWADGFNDTE